VAALIAPWVTIGRADYADGVLKTPSGTNTPASSRRTRMVQRASPGKSQDARSSIVQFSLAVGLLIQSGTMNLCHPSPAAISASPASQMSTGTQKARNRQAPSPATAIQRG